MLRIRPMQAKDIPFALRLTNQEKWGVTRTDLRRLMRLNPRGCFITYEGIARLGITTTTVYGRKLAWIGNVIVDKNYRGKSIGHALIEHAVSHLQKSRVQHIALYCYHEHVKFYEDLGFEQDNPFVRLRRNAPKRKQLGTPNISQRPPSLLRILAADRQAFGADRSKLIRHILAERTGSILGSLRMPSSASYLMVKEYGSEGEVGPWICTDPSRDDPDEMLTRALSQMGPVHVEASCMQSNWRAIGALKVNGFHTIREGYRMFFRERARIGDDSAQFALGFLDKG